MRKLIATVVVAVCALVAMPPAGASEPAPSLAASGATAGATNVATDREFALFAAACASHLASGADDYQTLEPDELVRQAYSTAAT